MNGNVMNGNGANSNAVSLTVITGPTGVGKSVVAMELAREFGGEIVNADSMQCYRHFDIGSAKPSEAMLSAVRHHLVSIYEPQDDVSAGVFCKVARSVLSQLHQQGVPAFVVGGSGLYILALLYGLVDESAHCSDGGNISDGGNVCVTTVGSAKAACDLSGEDISGEYLALVDEVDQALLYGGLAELRALLHRVDAIRAIELEDADILRTRRALQYWRQTGVLFSEAVKKHRWHAPELDATVIVLAPERREIYRGIERRVEAMLEGGLVAEVKGLVAQYGRDIRPLKSIGYSQVSQYLCGELTEPEMVNLIKRDTRRFAKRQLTWWRNYPRKLGWKDCASQLSSDWQRALVKCRETEESLDCVRRLIREHPDVVLSQRGAGVAGEGMDGQMPEVRYMVVGSGLLRNS